MAARFVRATTQDCPRLMVVIADHMTAMVLSQFNRTAADLGTFRPLNNTAPRIFTFPKI